MLNTGKFYVKVHIRPVKRKYTYSKSGMVRFAPLSKLITGLVKKTPDESVLAKVEINEYNKK